MQIRLPATTAVYTNASSGITISNASNIVNRTSMNNDTTTCRVTSSSSSAHTFFIKGFNFNLVPKNATITKLELSFAVSQTNCSTSAATPKVVYGHATNNYPGTCSVISGSGLKRYTFTGLKTTGGSSAVQDVFDEISVANGSLFGSAFGISITLLRASGTAEMIVYGADLLVEYTVPTPEYTMGSTAKSPYTYKKVYFNIENGSENSNLTLTPIFSNPSDVSATTGAVSFTNGSTDDTTQPCFTVRNNTMVKFKATLTNATGKDLILRYKDEIPNPMGVEIGSDGTYSCFYEVRVRDTNMTVVTVRVVDKIETYDVTYNSFESPIKVFPTFYKAKRDSKIDILAYAPPSDYYYVYAKRDNTSVFEMSKISGTNLYKYPITSIFDADTVIVISEVPLRGYQKQSSGSWNRVILYQKTSSGWVDYLKDLHLKYLKGTTQSSIEANIANFCKTYLKK